MIKSSKDTFSEQVLSNGAYRIVALIASVILWLTVLGRKEAVITREMPLKLIMKPSVTAVYDTSMKLTLKVAGERKIIKEFVDKEEALIIDLKDRGPGIYSIPLSLANLKLPRGVRLLSLNPQEMEVEIESRNDDGNK